MTRAEFDTYLLVVAILLGVIGVVNGLRPHKRWLGAGAVLLGVAAMVYRQGSSKPVVAIPCGLALACLVTDVARRVKA